MNHLATINEHGTENYTLNNHSIYFALFITQLTAIIAQGSLRSNLLELFIQIMAWGGLLGFSLYFGWQYRNRKDSKLPEQLTNGAAIVGMGAFLFQIITGNLTAGLLLLLSWLLIGLSFSLSKQRSLYFALVASTILLLYAASISRSSGFIVYITLFTLAAVMTLASNFYLTKNSRQVSTSINSQVTTDFPFKLPMSLLTVVILLITTGLYLFVPRPTPLHWGNFPAGGGQYKASDNWLKDKEKAGNGDKSVGTGEGQNNNDEQQNSSSSSQSRKDEFGYSGFDSELPVNEEKSNSGKNKSYTGGSSSNQLIFYMEGKEPQYLRGKIYDYFNGTSWKTTHKKTVQKSNGQGLFKISSPEENSDQYTITLVANLSTDSIFIPPATTELKFPSQDIGVDNYGAIIAPQSLSKDTTYSFKIPTKRAKIQGRPIRPTNFTDAPTAKELLRYTQLPKDLSQLFFQLSDKLTKDSSDRLAKARNVETYLRENYKYSLKSVYNSQGHTPMDEFLFDKKEGHCEYFATAMVTLIRAQKIPARLVTGFSVSEYNPITGYYEARGLNAHAWAEVWVKDVGWVTYEATPAYPLPKPSELKNTSESIEDYLDERAKNANLSDPAALTTLLLHTTQRMFEQFNLLIRKAWSTIKEGLVWSGKILLYYGWAILLLAAVLFSAYHYLRYYFINIRIKRSLAEAEKMSADKQVEASYQSMKELFTLHQHPPEESWTIQQYQAELIQYYPELSKEIKSISKGLNLQLYHNIKVSNKKVSGKFLKQAESIVQHKFEIPLPAEKKLIAIRDFFKRLSNKVLPQTEAS